MDIRSEILSHLTFHKILYYGILSINAKLLSVSYCSVNFIVIFIYYINHEIFTRDIEWSFYSKIFCWHISIL